MFTLNPWKTEVDTSITDNDQNVVMLGEGICYYILAKEAKNTSNVSKSNIVCLSAKFLIHIPNAFTPGGFNSNFRPEGTLIDYKNSNMKIYNRWGQLIYDSSINQGWDGKDTNGVYCEQGVYFYYLEIYSTKNEKQIKQGTFTLLR